MKKRNVVLLMLAVALLGLFATACSSSDSGATEVQVKLSEYVVVMDKTSIPAGPVKFVITNIGAADHELVLEDAGAHDEPFELNGEESEVEDVHPGDTVTLEWDLEAGDYQLACYFEDHFEQGMITSFTVTAP
jgi:plastocyanin